MQSAGIWWEFVQSLIEIKAKASNISFDLTEKTLNRISSSSRETSTTTNRDATLFLELQFEDIKKREMGNLVKMKWPTFQIWKTGGVMQYIGSD